MKAKNKLFTLLLLGSGATAVTAVMNQMIKLSAVSKNLLAEPKSLCYKWRFGNIHYTKAGTGKPLLLIHDLHAASSGYEWEQMIHYLKDDYTVYTIDLLGCGRSEKPNLTYTNFLYVQLISDFIKSEIGHRTNVAVTGVSASFVIMACGNSPELFDQIMLINPNTILTCSQIPGRRSKIYKFVLDLPVLGTLMYHIAMSRQAIMKEFRDEFYCNPYSVKSAFIDAYYESAHLGESPKSFYASVTCNYTKCNIVNALRKIDNSIYIIAGRGMENAKDNIREYQTYNSAIEGSVIPDSRYLPQMENPVELYKVMQMYYM